MVYVPTAWVDGVTSANAARLNNIETGLSAASRANVVNAVSGTTAQVCAPSGTGSAALNRGCFSPFWFDPVPAAGLSITSVGANVTAGGTAGAAIRVGLWRANANGMPDFTNALVTSGDLASTATGVKSVALVTTLTRGLYWGGVVMHTATCTIQAAGHGITVIDTGGVGSFQFCYVDGLSGAFPSSGTATPNGDYSPLLYVTVA